MSRKRKQRQALFLLDRAAGAAVLRGRIASGRWWLFISVNRAGLPFLETIEQAHYFTKKSRGDYEMMAFPWTALGPIGVGMAHKRRMTARQLSQHLDAAGMTRESETLAKHGNDLIVFADSREDFERVQRWMEALAQGETAAAR